MNLNLLFTKRQLLNYHMNISASSMSVNRNNSYHLVGLYYNSSVVNLNLALFKLKKNFSIMFSTCLKTSLNVLIVNTIENKILWNSFTKMYKAYYLSYFLGSWWNGLLKNFKKFIKYKNKNKKSYNFYKKRFPVFCFYINFKKFHKLDDFSQVFNSEVNRSSLLNLMFVDSSINTYKAPSVLLQNIKNMINSVFLNKISLSCVKKAFFIKKKKFFIFSYRKFNIFNLKKNFRKIFFEYYYCSINKKNFHKRVQWN